MPVERETRPIRDELHRAGPRATESRVAVLATLRSAGVPVSHGEMESLVARHNWNRTTVYRNLLDLARVGLARRFDVGDHTWRFEAAGHAREHPHFVCNSCGDIECLDGVQLAVEHDRGPRALRGREVDVQVRGVCDRCS